MWSGPKGKNAHSAFKSHDRFNIRSKKSKLPLTRYRRPNNRRVAQCPFPPELYRSIIEWVADNEDLYNLSLTSRLCHKEAERVLYRSINLAKNPRAPVLWANTMLDCPWKAMRVHALTLQFDTSFLIVPDMVLPSLQLISQALRLLFNLKELVLIGHPLVMMHPIYNWIFEDCPFSLEVFHNSVFPAEAVLPFLSEQPDLRAWKQSGPHLKGMVDDTFLPRLEVLEIHASAMVCFTTPRPLRRLHLKLDSLCDRQGDRDIVSRLALFGSSLTTLIIERATTVSVTLAELFNFLANQTPNLKLLCFSGFLLPDSPQVDDKTASSFRELECLVLADTEASAPTTIRRTTTARSFLAVCPAAQVQISSANGCYSYTKQQDGRIIEAVSADSLDLLDLWHE